ncbi:hypothetical protein SteCoe_9685 [Stentor coeruleus]|uniref:Uncharacterized protein n=1 Tax=Stentor coeruleus TaxID=5963 RepID=A0A1R2CH61_9CILI|nr:hypothetical protein SteCoe_9685 [Stentor coeruleus]
MDILGSPIEISDSDQTVNRICKLKLHYWRKGILFLDVLAMIFCISSFITPRWVEQGKTENFWRGSLMKCGGCNGKFEGASYKQISEWSCGDMDGYCETFDGLYKAGIAVLLIQSMFLLLLVVGIYIIVCELVNKHYENKLVFVTTLITPLCEIIALITWILTSGAKMNNECYSNATNMEKAHNVCATHGPILMIMSILMSICATILFIFIRPATKKAFKNKIIPVDDR